MTFIDKIIHDKKNKLRKLVYKDKIKKVNKYYFLMECFLSLVVLSSFSM